MEKNNIKNIDDIIDILCDGTKKEIEEVLEKYKIKYGFCKVGEFSIESRVLNIMSRGQGIYNPNCVKYFGWKYSYKN